MSYLKSGWLREEKMEKKGQTWAGAAYRLRVIKNNKDSNNKNLHWEKKGDNWESKKYYRSENWIVINELPQQLKVVEKDVGWLKEIWRTGQRGEPAFLECLLYTRSFTIFTYLVLKSAPSGEYRFIFIVILERGNWGTNGQFSGGIRMQTKSGQWRSSCTVQDREGLGAFQQMKRQEELGEGADLTVAVKMTVLGAQLWIVEFCSCGWQPIWGSAVDLRIVLGKWGEPRADEGLGPCVSLASRFLGI